MKQITTLAIASCMMGLGSVASFSADDVAYEGTFEKRWYVNSTVGFEGFAIMFDNKADDDIAANAYYGIGGTLELCSNGTGNTTWLDLCAGGHGFVSLGSATQNISAALGGGSSETDFYSYGGYAKARMNWGAFALAPYGGLRQIDSTTTINTVGSTTQNNDVTALFGGLETDISFMNGRGNIGTRIEYGGTTDGDVDFQYVSGNAYFGVRF